MNTLRRIATALGLAWSMAAVAAPPPAAGFAPVAGAALPLDAVFADATGRSLPLRAYVHDVPTVIVPGYYSCPNLCSTVFQGVLEALALGRAAPTSYRVLGVSIDASDTAARAAQRQQAYASLLPRTDLHLLTGTEAGIARLAGALGYRFRRGGDGQFAHPAGFVVVTPGGRVAAAFAGVRFDPVAVRAALEAAGREEETSLSTRLVMFCTRFDPSGGRLNGLVMRAVRAVAIATALGLAGLLWWRRSR